ncbi:MAG: elongation factor [Thermotogota bacterium]|nr:elongation factor [Thermotogota bacterium]MDK2865422.1 elongation factor [Thermotogota bacterium]
MVLKDVPVEMRRVFTVVGHNGSGKTVLGDAVLKEAGVVSRIGEKFLDYDKISQERGSSVSSAVASFEYSGHRFTIIDTPGFGDFVSDTMNAIFVAENVVSVVNATAGVEIQTERTWRLARSMGKPIMVFVNQMDKERASFDSAVESLKEAFEEKITPIQLPIGEEAAFRGIIDLIARKAYVLDGENLVEAEIPEDLKDRVEELRTSLIEDIVETDEELMEKYLEGEDVSPEMLARAFKKAYLAGEIVPVLCGSALNGVGARQLLDTLIALGASPVDAPGVKAITVEGENEVLVKPEESEPFVGYIFKAVVDPFVGKQSFVKVLAGELKPGDTFVNGDTEEKVTHVYVAVGKNTEEVERARVGDVILLLKLKKSSVGDTLCHKSRRLIVTGLEYPEPMISKAVNPKSKADVDKISNGLARLADSDPTFKWEFDPETGETVISGLGSMHLDVMVDRLKKLFGVDVEVGNPKIAYRETIRSKAVAEHKHKKQTGGHGQYGHVKIELEPLPRGAGFEFVDKIVGGVIPRNFIPSVEKGIREAMKKGVLAGYPVVDVRVTLFDGSYHEVDSSDISFQIAAIQAFKKGMEAANPVILEPIMEVEIFVPNESTGDVMGDITSRRGRPMGMESVGRGVDKIVAQVPLAELLDFSARLSAITSGRGYFTMKFSHYQEVPPDVQQKIVAERKREEGE